MTDVVDALRAQLAPDSLLASDAIEPRYLGDWQLRNDSARPAALVKARTTADVAVVLRECNALGVPIVAQGGRTGLAGGATPSNGCVILSLERMKAIEPANIDSATLVVEAGATLQAVQQAAAQAGMLFPLDIGGRGSCTVGGNISTNAGGNRVLRYGMMRDLVLGIEVVLANGEVITSLNDMLKNNAGYDLKQLFIGSEGTLGIVTRAVLRLFPQTSSVQTAMCALKDFDATLALLRLAKEKMGADLSAFEVLWEGFYRLGTAGLGRRPPVPAGHAFYVLIESLGTEAVQDQKRFEEFIETAFDRGIVLDATIAQSIKESQEIWAVRDSSGELERTLGPYAAFDVSLPIRSIGSFAEECRRRMHARWPECRAVWFGHIADSNIHICVANEGAPANRHDLDEVIYDCVSEFRGSISAEHGIGLLKRDFINRSQSSQALAAMRLLKRTFDPKGILNPGKVLA